MNTPDYWRENVPGASLVSLKVGGTIRYVARLKTEAELLETLQVAKERALPIKIMGGGSNVVLPDAGFAGVIIQPAFHEVRMVSKDEAENLGVPLEPVIVSPRYQPAEGDQFLQLQAEQAQQQGEWGYVEAGAGVPWGQIVTTSMREGFSGLHWFARIPCQVGGAVFNNIHGEKHLLSESVAAVKVVNSESLQTYWLGADQLNFGYDQSRFHTQPEVITRVLFRLQQVGKEAVQVSLNHYLDWTKEKARIQPSGPNCGSVFQNLSAEQAQGKPTLSAGWYVDHSGYKGKRIGNMQVYPGHANFIVNLGNGTQAEFIQLVEQIRLAVWQQFEVNLEPEVECMDEQGNRKVWQSLPSV